MDTIKQFTNDYKHLTELGVTHTAFTNDATTTKVVKNVLIQGIGGKKSVDLMLDGKPLYRNLSVPANGTLKLENENLVVPPSSTLSYKAVNNEAINTFKSAIPSGRMSYIDSDGKSHGIVMATASIKYYVNGTLIHSSTALAYTDSDFSAEVIETDTTVYIAAHTGAVNGSSLIMFSYSKNNSSVALIVNKDISGVSATSDGNNTHVSFRLNETTGMLSFFFKKYSSATAYGFFMGTNNYANSSNMFTPDTISVVSTINVISLNTAFLNNGNLLIAHGTDKYHVVSPFGATVASGTFSTPNTVDGNYKPSIYVHGDNSFDIHFRGATIKKYSSTFIFVSQSAATYYSAFLYTPIGEIVCSTAGNDLVILNSNLTVKTTIVDYFAVYSSGDLFNTYGGLFLKHLLDYSKYKLCGVGHDVGDTYNIPNYYYYNAINIKIDGVEVTV